MTEITIRTDVPLPAKSVRNSGRKPIYPFDRLAVSHSFHVDFDDVDDDANKKVRTRVVRAVCHANKTNAPKTFEVRDTPQGVGVWRTK